MWHNTCLIDCSCHQIRGGMGLIFLNIAIPPSSNFDMLFYILISYKFRIGYKCFGRIMMAGEREKKYIDK